jgi:hypothetical protein
MTEESLSVFFVAFALRRFIVREDGGPGKQEDFDEEAARDVPRFARR